MEIRVVGAGEATLIMQMGQLLVDGFREMAPDDWNTLEEGQAEVLDVVEQGFALAALEGERVLGWIGGLPEYNGNVWELHPLVVAPGEQGRGIGRALVGVFEQQVAQRGGLTVFLGTDDQAGWTSLAGVDLYPDPLGHLAQLQNVARHPFAFYQKLGYALVGVVPDANGPGKPDIFMAKRVGLPPPG
ncbi:MAG: GNAT family N-acetyltransferase [Anaerolineae bacterium]|nr:GNAT family N-acetyltransferase [Anaerolineae bacterium]